MVINAFMWVYSTIFNHKNTVFFLCIGYDEDSKKFDFYDSCCFS